MKVSNYTSAVELVFSLTNQVTKKSIQSVIDQLTEDDESYEESDEDTLVLTARATEIFYALNKLKVSCNI